MKLDEKAIGWIIREKKKGTPTRIITEIEGITRQRVIDYKQYRETGRIPELRNPGRPRKELSDGEIGAIKEVYEEYRCNAVVLQTILRKKGFNVSKNKIHEVLDERLCKREEQKKEEEVDSLRKKAFNGVMAYRLVFQRKVDDGLSG